MSPAFQGISASGGLSSGHAIHWRTAAPVGDYEAGDRVEEARRLDVALGRAAQQLSLLVAGVTGETGDIINFQLEILSDPTLLAKIHAMLQLGTSAIEAWTSALDAEIQDYRSSGDDYLSARSEDLADLQGRVARSLHGIDDSDARKSVASSIVIADVLPPSAFFELDLRSVKGIAVAGGSPSSHAAILARARGIPMIVGCGEDLLFLHDGERVFLDADLGVLATNLTAQQTAEFEDRVQKHELATHIAQMEMTNAASTSRGDHVRIYANLDDPRSLSHTDVRSFDGVGLVRTEFMFDRGAWPDEDAQYQSYKQVVEWAAGRPVTIRALDFGGDKPIKGITVEGEKNPFLGLRGIRLLRRHSDLLRIQLRALLRASALGDVRVMIPMVTVPSEVSEYRTEMLSQLRQLQESGVQCRLPQLGIMVEVPSAALIAGRFEVDFYSIGTNDLVQYTYAAARDDHRLTYLSEGDLTPVLELVRQVVAAASQKGLEVSVCGDLASNPRTVGNLLDAGIRSLSVSPATVAAVKQAVRRWPAEERRT